MDKQMIRNLFLRCCFTFLVLASLPRNVLSANIVAFFENPDINEIQASGQHLYAISTRYNYSTPISSLLILDIGHGPQPSLLSSTSTRYRAWSLWVSGTYAYVGNDIGLDVFNLSNPLTPVRLNNTSEFLAGSAVTTLNGHSYVLDNYRNYGFHVINLTDPANPYIVASDLYNNNTWAGWGITSGGSHVFVAMYDGLVVYDVSDPSTPLKVSSTTGLGAATDVTILNNYLFVTYENNVLQMNNISDPANPILTASIATSEKPSAVFAHHESVYVAINNKIDVFDFTDPSNLQFVESINFPGEVRDIWATDSYLYVADSTGLHVVDFSDNPVAVAGPDQVVWDGDTVNLDGSNSSSGTYKWTQIDGPVVTIINENEAQASFIAPLIDTFEAILTFQLKLISSSGIEFTDSCIVKVRKKSDIKILFTSNRDGNFELYTMSPDKSGLTRLTSNTAKDSLGRFSPDGKTIAFVRNDNEIWLMDVNGLNQRFLHNGKSLAFSPDGSFLAFENDLNIYVYSFETKQTEIRVLGDMYKGANANPDWYGEDIVYMNKFIFPDYFQFQNIRKVKATGSTQSSGLTNYTDIEEGYPNQPRWSPDGTEIMYTFRVRYGVESLNLVKPDGSDPQVFATAPIDSESGGLISPVWSPDGSEILCSLDGRLLVINRNDRQLYRWLTDDNLTYSEYPLHWFKIPSTASLKGDIDGDGDVDLIDLITLAKILAGINTSPSVNIAADVNNDEKLNTAEMIYILNELAD